MAEALAGWLAFAAVGIARDMLTSAIKEQANLLWNFGDDLEDMNSVLESISAVLQDAERRSVKETLVQLWLKRLKHAAGDISDMLEDYQDTSGELKAKMPGVLSCLPIARKKIAVANRMKSMRNELKKIKEDIQYFNFSQGGTSSSVEEHDDVYETSSRLPEIPIIGRNGEKQEIIKLLSASTNNDETVIVAIYGLGGMGKSTLAKLVYNDEQSKKYDHRIWVYVSRDFSLKKIGTSIISQLRIGGQQNWDTLQMIDQCLDNIWKKKDKKVLIVLDDLWEEKDTELGKLRSMLHVGKKGRMIDVIVTTHDEDIARKVSTSKPYKLQPLKDDTCWEIIKRSSRFEDQDNKKDKEEIGLDIAKKCGGMPLAAKTLGYMLNDKPLFVWTEINNSDNWNESFEDNGGVLPSLKLSYERMPRQLRICFSYCAIFPKGHNIAEDDLIHQWISLNFIKPSKGKEYIRQLLGMSFLEVSKLPKTSQKYVAQYTMHDLVHDLARLIMGDELIVSYVPSKRNTHGQKYCRYASVTKYDRSMKLSNIFPSKMRALHFSDSRKLDLACGAFSFAKCLRILDFSGCSSILLPASIGQLKQLKHLIAPRMQNEGLPEYIPELSKLQYLNLNGPSQISALPESIGKLGCLEYLSLSGCSGISKLPGSFGDLKSMMHLDMSGCSGIRELPDSLGNLTNLQRLELSECSGVKAIPESLCGLMQLQYLNLSSCCYIARLPEAIGSLVNLQYLKMSSCSGVRELPESFRRLCNLLHLDLGHSCIENGLPGALRGLTALQYLDMSRNKRNLEKDDLPVAMRNLSNLKVLNLSSSLDELFNVSEGDCYLDFIGTLTNLEHLDLSWNINLYYLPESIGNLKRLHTLNLENCHLLDSLPESIGGAIGLKSVLLDGCTNELMDQASSVLHYSLKLPLFKVRADNVSGHSNLHLLEGENVGELRIVSLENIRFPEEAKRLDLLTKHNLLTLKLAWTFRADRLIEDKDLLGQLVPPISLKDLTLKGYTSPSFPNWLMAMSHHLPNLTSIKLHALPECSNLPPLGQLPYLESLRLTSLPRVKKIDSGICGGKGAFPRLAYFQVYGLRGLEEWNTTYPSEDGGEEFMFPMLDVLDVQHCPLLRLKPCLPNCRQCKIAYSDQVISSLEEVETSSHRCNSTPTTTSLFIRSRRQSFWLFHHFPALQELEFSSCLNMESLPEGIQQLSSLQSLKLDSCIRIRALPEWLSDISSLKKLVISGCPSIKSLPPCIQLLTNLQQLVIGQNQELQRWCESEENKAKLAHIKDIIYE